MDSLLERHQAEILEDLNSLGQYSRLSQYGGIPVHISAYIVDTDHGSCQDQNDGAESDSGISDTNHDSDQETTDQEDIEKEKNPDDDCDMDMECETILEDFVNPVDVLGLQAIVGLTPPPEDQSQDILGLGTGQDALEAELVHIDEQLMNIEDDLGHIDEAFYMMDQQLAETISDDVMYDNDIFNNNLVDVNAPDVNLDNLGVEGNNPFDDWQREAFANIDDLVLENVSNVELQHIPVNNNLNMEEVICQSNSNEKDDEILQDPDLFPTNDTTTGSAILEEFDDDLFGGAQSKIRSEIDRLIKNDVVMPQMPVKTNASQPYIPITPLPDEIFEPEEAPLFNVTESSLSRESSVDKDLLEEIDVADVDVDQNDEDIIMQVLRESNIDFDEIPIDGEEIVKTELKEEDIKEEVIDVEDVSFELNLVDGASAKIEIDYEKLHSDIKSNFQESEDGSAVAEFTLSPHLSMTYNPGFNARAFEHDHNYGIAAKVEPTLLSDSSASRRRNVSESSGYSSMNEELVGSRCRDEKMARKMSLPFSVYDIINSPVDTFSEMLGRPGLTAEQSQICRDIRRRGKNKVAAQNCRKRKMDTIEELQSQVDQVRRRKEQLLKAREQLETDRALWSSKLSFLEQTVLAGIGKDLGMFTLEVTDSAVVVTSRLTNSHQLLAAVGGAEKYPRGGRSRD